MSDTIESSFKLVYDGSEYDNHAIDAETLGNSLINLSQLLNEANQALNGNDANISVEVQATKEGSFETLLNIVQEGQNTVNIAKVLGLSAAGSFFAGGLLGILKELKGTKYSEITIDDNTQTIKVGDTEIKSSTEINKLLRNKAVRSNIEEVFYKPVGKGVSLRVMPEGQSDPILEIDSDSAKFFKSPTIRNRSETVTEDVSIKIATTNFTKKTGWRIILPDGNEVAVKIKDEKFFEAVKLQQVKFFDGVEFEVELETKTIDADGELSKSYIIHKFYLDKDNDNSDN